MWRERGKSWCKTAVLASIHIIFLEYRPDSAQNNLAGPVDRFMIVASL
ncbi:MAG: hypothetical protein AAF614_24895 [Chloroflexota bacterium]